VKFPRDRVTVTARTPARLHLPSEMFRVKTSAATHGIRMPCFPDDGRQGFFREKVKKWKCEIVSVMVSVTALLSLACLKVGDNEVSDPTVKTHVVADDLGRKITVPVDIKRVISLAPSVTEIIYAVSAGDRLVGDTTYCNYPEEAKAIQKVGDTLNPNMEVIVALKPDIVFVSGASQLENFTNTLDQNGIAVYVINPTNLDGVFDDMMRLGDLFGTADKTVNLVVTLSGRESFIRHSLLLPRVGDPVRVVSVFAQISKEPLFSIGKESFLNQVIESAGGQSVTKNVPSAFPKLSKETALALQPDAIILSDSSDNQEPNEVFANSPAVKNGRVFRINADILSRPGPRLIDALEQIAKDLHPEKFK
jgi:ABC-type Fe3+-hydroxamate transport system, periplasmic component